MNNYATKTDLANCVKVVLGNETTTVTGTNSYVCSVSIPTGYTFLANIGVYTSGFVSSASFDPLTRGTRVFFKSGEVSNGWCKIVVLCVKTS